MRVVARRRTGFTHDVEIEGGHTLVFDEPRDQGGDDAGPSPTRTVAAALAACTAITVEMYAEHKDWELGEVEVEVTYTYGRASTMEDIVVTLRVPTPIDDEQRTKLLQIAGKCPVHRALRGETEVTISDRIETA
jgi:putative redox protein